MGPYSRVPGVRLGRGIGLRLRLAHPDIYLSIDDPDRIGLERHDDRSTQRLAGSHIEAPLMKGAFHNAVDQDAVGEIGMLVRAQILCRIKLAFGAIDGDRKWADLDLRDILVLEFVGHPSKMPILVRKLDHARSPARFERVASLQRCRFLVERAKPARIDPLVARLALGNDAVGLGARNDAGAPHLLVDRPQALAHRMELVADDLVELRAGQRTAPADRRGARSDTACSSTMPA